MASIHEILRGDIIPQSGIDVAVGRNSLDFNSPVVPLLDMHMRRAEFHDSGTSGILTFNSEQNRLELNASESGNRGLVPGVFLEVYDATGGTTIPNTFTSIIFDTERFNLHPDVFTLDTVNGLVQIHMSGVYEFEFKTSIVGTSASTRATCLTFPRRSTDGGIVFGEIFGNRAWLYHRNNINGEHTAHVKFIQTVEVGFIYGIRARAEAGPDCTTIANGSSFFIKKLE